MVLKQLSNLQEIGKWTITATMAAGVEFACFSPSDPADFDSTTSSATHSWVTDTNITTASEVHSSTESGTTSMSQSTSVSTHPSSTSDPTETSNSSTDSLETTTDDIDDSNSESSGADPSTTDDDDSTADDDDSSDSSDDVSCEDGETRRCGLTDVGECEYGKQHCVDHHFVSECEGVVWPMARNCAVDVDRDCNGVPDNTLDAACTCKVGMTVTCETHPQDGVGTCRAGEKSCILDGGGAISTWSKCLGSVGPTAVDRCDIAADTNCDGKLDCECTPNDTVACGECGEGKKTCESSGKWGDCIGAKGPKVVYYRDADADTFGDPAVLQTSCGGAPSGFVVANSDCCDADNRVFPGAAGQNAGTNPPCTLRGDFNCDGEETHLTDPPITSCMSGQSATARRPICGRHGWSEFPSCGYESQWVECSEIEFTGICEQSLFWQFPLCQ